MLCQRINAYIAAIALVSGGCSLEPDDVDETSMESALYTGTNYDYQYPWTVDIRDLPGLTYRCEGVLVAPRYVLTTFSCLTYGGQFRYEVKRSSPDGYLYDSQDNGIIHNVGFELYLVEFPRQFYIPAEYLQPAELPDTFGSIGQTGTVVSGHNLGQFNTWNATITSTYYHSWGFDAFSADLCGASSYAGAGFIVQETGWSQVNVVRGVRWGAASGCSSSEFVQVAPASAAIRQVMQPAPVTASSDILWRSSSSGAVGFWFMNGGGGVLRQDYVVNPGNGWAIQGVGDFDGDGVSDILWRDGSSLAIWFMKGGYGAGSIRQQAWPADPGSWWIIQRIGDFNGDGRSDILWRQSGNNGLAIWFMNGSAHTDGYPSDPGGGWTIRDVGDFNGDGKSDILWRTSSNSGLAIWLMNGSTHTDGYPTDPGSWWLIQKTGDFNGDGKTDILWRLSGNNGLSIWFMNGSAHTDGHPTDPGSGWLINRAGDFNGDGKADVLWRTSTNNNLAIWRMNGSAHTDVYLTDPGSDWTTQGTGKLD